MTAHTKDRQPEVVESSMSLERKSKSNKKNEKDICKATELGPYDILFGRSKTSFNNTGNRRFRVTVSMYLPAYLATKTKGEKSELFNKIHNFLENEVGARFLKPSTKNGEYIHLDKKKVRQKIGHALRDAAVNRHQFSTMAEWTTQNRNTSRRTNENEQQVEDDDESVIKPMQIESSSSQEKEEQTKPILIESCPPQEQVVVPSSEHEIIKLVKKSFQDEGECCDDDTALLVSSSNRPITAPRTRPTFRRVVSIQEGDFVRGEESFQEEEDSSQSSCSTRDSSDNDDDSEDDHDEDSSIDSFLAELLAVDP